MKKSSTGKPGLTLAKLRALRAFLFPTCVADTNHIPYFSFERKDEWVTSAAANFFIERMGCLDPQFEAESMSVDVQSLVDAQPLEVIQNYRAFILPKNTSALPFFSIDNSSIWILPHPFQLFISSVETLVSQDIKLVHLSPKREEGPVALGKRKARSFPRAMDAIIVISDDSDQSSDEKEPRSSKKSKPALIQVRVASKRPASKIKAEPSLEIKPEPINPDLGFIDLTTSDSMSDKSQRKSKIADSKSTKISIHPVTKTSKLHESEKRPSAKSLLERWYPNFSSKSSKNIRFTKKDSVEALKYISDIPLGWDVLPKLTAFVLDLSDHPLFAESEGSKSIISSIRHEDQCSWGGSAGKRDGDVFVEDLLGEGKVKARRAVLDCNGIKICEHFNRDLLQNFEGWERDETEMKRFWALELSANEEEYLDPEGPLLRFYLRVTSSTCTYPDCNGKPIIRKLKKASRYNKNVFIGCSKWRFGDDNHRYIPLGQDIDEKQFVQLFENDGKLKSTATRRREDDTEVEEGECCVVVHPRSHRDKCGFTHKTNGHLQTAKIIPYNPCPSRLLIFEPIDTSIRKVLVIPKFPHNHPRHSHVKPTFKEKKLVETVAKAAGKPRVTAKALRTSSTTAALLDGKSWEIAVPGLVDNQALTKFLAKINSHKFPKGLDWEGVQYEMSERESQLPLKSRYIHSVVARGDVKLIVTMNPALATFIHQVRFLAIDYTFKRVRGEFNEWEVASNIDRYKMRASLASLYCNRATREAFRLLVREFLEVVEVATGKPLQFHFINTEARLRCLIFDAEAAQMQGCGDAILPLNQPDLSGISTKDPLVFVQYFTKTCVQHFLRNIDELPKSVPREEINRLKCFPGLSSQEAIDEWKQVCRKSPHKAIIDWFKQKEMHPWYLPSLNSFLSPMDKDSWAITPNDTNIAETAHAARNKDTSINAPLLSAIFEARFRDEEIVLRLEQFEASGVLANRWNGPQERERRSAARRDARYQKGQAVRSAQTKYSELEKELELLVSQRQSSLKASQKLQTRLDEIRQQLDSLSLPDADARVLKDERKTLNKENKTLLEERALWAKQISTIKDTLKDLKASKLKGSLAHDSRPSSEASTPSPESRSASPSLSNDDKSEPLAAASTEVDIPQEPLTDTDTDFSAAWEKDDFFDFTAPVHTDDDFLAANSLNTDDSNKDDFLFYDRSPMLTNFNPLPDIPSTPHRPEFTAPEGALSPSVEALLAQYGADPGDDVDWSTWDRTFEAEHFDWYPPVPMGDESLGEASLLIMNATLQHDRNDSRGPAPEQQNADTSA